MNKFLFWAITIVVSLLLCIMVYFVGYSYLTSDQYVPMENMEEDTEGTEEFMKLEDFLNALKNSETEEQVNVLFEKMPLEMRLVQARAFLTMLFCMIVPMVLVIFIGWLFKDKKKIDFGVLELDPSDKKVNIVRISLYILLLMVAFLASQVYPVTYLLGWVVTLLWLGYVFLLMVWTLNIMYAFRDRRQQNKIGRS